MSADEMSRRRQIYGMDPSYSGGAGQSAVPPPSQAGINASVSNSYSGTASNMTNSGMASQPAAKPVPGSEDC